VAAGLEHAGKFWNGRVQVHERQCDTGSDGFKSAVPKRHARAVSANEMSLRITGADFLQGRQIDVESNLNVCRRKLGSTSAAKIEASSSMR
jgi:hypothetical protein